MGLRPTRGGPGHAERPRPHPRHAARSGCAPASPTSPRTGRKTGWSASSPWPTTWCSTSTTGRRSPRASTSTSAPSPATRPSGCRNSTSAPLGAGAGGHAVRRQPAEGHPGQGTRRGSTRCSSPASPPAGSTSARSSSCTAASCEQRDNGVAVLIVSVRTRRDLRPRGPDRGHVRGQDHRFPAADGAGGGARAADGRAEADRSPAGRTPRSPPRRRNAPSRHGAGEPGHMSEQAPPVPQPSPARPEPADRDEARRSERASRTVVRPDPQGVDPRGQHGHRHHPGHLHRDRGRRAAERVHQHDRAARLGQLFSAPGHAIARPGTPRWAPTWRCSRDRSSTRTRSRRCSSRRRSARRSTTAICPRCSTRCRRPACRPRR